MTLASLIPAYLADVKSRLSLSTYVNYQERLARFQEFAGREAAEPPLFHRYVAAMRADGLAPASISIYYSALRSLYTWAVDMGHARANPVPKLRLTIPASVKTVFTEEEVAKLTLAMPEEWKWFTLLGYHSGARLADVAMFKKEQLDCVNRTCTFTPQKTVRFGKQVQVPLPDWLVDGLCTLAKTSENIYVFPEICGLYARFDHKAISWQFKQACTKAGIAGKSFHNLRHSFVSRLVNNGANPIVVASMTGHSLKQIMTYAHVNDESKRKALGL